MDTPTAAAITASMSGAMAALWKYTISLAKHTDDRWIAKLNVCEKKHWAAQTEMVAFSRRVGRMEGYTQARNDMKALPNGIVKRFQAESA